MKSQQYYCVTTKCFTLRCAHEEWLVQTQELYNQVLLFYYNLFLDLEMKQPGILKSSGNQQILRELEKLTVVGREKKPVPYLLPWSKLPLYFRRAAVNASIASAKSHLERVANKQFEQSAKSFRDSVTFYKGMYRKLEEHTVELKVWDGTQWHWLHCRLSGNKLPDKEAKDTEVLSPSVVLKNGLASLHVPVKELVSDGRKTLKRVADGCRVCSLQFTNQDTLAIAVVLDDQGKQISTRFFRGGKQYKHRCGQILAQIDKSDNSRGESEKAGKEAKGKPENKLYPVQIEDTRPRICHNQRYWMRLKHISDNFAHNISRQIINYCVEEGVSILILTESQDKYTKCIMLTVGNWSPLHLNFKIRTQLSYKAWKEGIVIIEGKRYRTSLYCSVCGSSVKRKGASFLCENGHQGNYFLNSARNLGRRCLDSLKKNNNKETLIK